MATNRFVNVNGGNWNDAANWLLDDDGVTARVPLNTDDVVITATLGSSKTITIATTTAVCKSADFSTAGNTFTLTSSGTQFHVYGSLTLKTGMTCNLSATVRLAYGTSGTLTTNGVTMSGTIVYVYTNSALTLGDDLACGSLYVSNGGSLNTGAGNYSIAANGNFGDGAGGGTATLTLGSSTISCLNVAFANTTLTVNSNTATVNLTTAADRATHFGGKEWGGTITIAPATGKTVTLSGTNTFGNLTLNGAGALTFAAAQTVTGTTTLTQGILDLNGGNLTTANFSSSNSNTRVLQDTATGHKVVLKGLTGTIFDMSTATNLTVDDAPDIDIGTSALAQTADVTFAGGGKTFGDFKVTKHAGDYDCILTGANTFGSFTLETPDDTYQYSDVKFTAGTTTTVTSFVATGTSSYNINIQSVTGSTHTLSDSAGTNTVSYCTIANSVAEGGATWDADDGTNTDGGGNTGWVWPVGGGLPIPVAMHHYLHNMGRK